MEPRYGPRNGRIGSNFCCASRTPQGTTLQGVPASDRFECDNKDGPEGGQGNLGSAFDPRLASAASLVSALKGSRPVPCPGPCSRRCSAQFSVVPRPSPRCRCLRPVRDGGRKECSP